MEKDFKGTVIYGASDDLIEIEGAINEEFPTDKEDTVVCSDGTMAEIVFDSKGRWKCLLKNKGPLFQKIGKRPDGGGEPGDEAMYFLPGLTWVMCGKIAEAKE